MTGPTAEVFPAGRIRRLATVPPRRTPPDGAEEAPVRSLHLNEAPFPPSPAAVEAMREAAAGLNRYPDHDGGRLVEALSLRTGAPAERIVIGSGSNELLYASAEVTLDPGDQAISPVPGFPTYAKTIALRGAVHRPVPVRADGVVDVDAVLAAVTAETRLVYVATPHNPTGGLLERRDVERLVAGLPSHVFLHFDEAYYEFGRHAGGPETLALLETCRAPWIATRSFSKAYGLAGARIGYGVTSSPEVAAAFRKVRVNFSVNAVALAGALAALEDDAHLARLLDHTAAERSRLAHLLDPLGFVALPSAANFLTVVPPRPAADLSRILAARNVFVLPFDWPGQPAALRITIGTASDTDAVVAGLREALEACG